MIIPKPNEIIFYTAGKTWQASKFLSLLSKGYNINARWIKHPKVLKSPTDEHDPETHKDENLKRNIWETCKEDCLNADAGFLYTEPVDGNTLSGALVELGHITGFNKPFYICGTSESIEPVGNSDRAWKSQKCVHILPHINIFEAMTAACEHYRDIYSWQWNMRRNNGVIVHNTFFGTKRVI